jgi:hypothetical protein
LAPLKERLQKCVTSLEAFDSQKARKRFGNPEVVTLEAAIDKALSSTFGYGTLFFVGGSNAHSVWPTFLECDEGRQFFLVGGALISGADEMSIKGNRDD